MLSRIFPLAILFVAVPLLIGLLLFPYDRVKELNSRLSKSEKALRIDPSFEERVLWIAKYSGVDKPVKVNQRINQNCLNVVVVNSSMKPLTRCERGNAIYNPALDAIFIDEYLVKPIDLPFLGPSEEASTQESRTMEEYDFIPSTLNFIIAHELGHRKLRHKSSAFFPIDWLRVRKKDVGEEVAADRIACETLSKAYLADDVPTFVCERNALGIVGLFWQLTPANDRAATDLIGAIKALTITALFSSSPYSPFRIDKSHPSLLQRTTDAINRVQNSSDVLKNHLQVTDEEIRRINMIEQCSLREVRAPGPIEKLEFDNGVCKVTTGRIPGLSEVGSIYSFDPKDEKTTFGSLSGTTQVNRSLSTQSSQKANFDLEKLQVSIREHFHQDGDVELGNPQIVGRNWNIPVKFSDNFFSIVELDRESTAPAIRAIFNPVQLQDDISISSVSRCPDGWFVLKKNQNAFNWSLSKVTSDGKETLYTKQNFLGSYLGPPMSEHYLDELEPGDGHIAVLDNDRILVWHTNDSAWLVEKEAAHVVFHPLEYAVNVEQIEKKRVLFWIKNGSKFYILNV